MQTDTLVSAEADDAFLDSEDDDEDHDEWKCQGCDVQKPAFLCGSDNRTYSSYCRLEYHNCIHHVTVRLKCIGFCPCKNNDLHAHKKMERQKMSNYKNNHDITLTPRDFSFDNHHYQYLKYSKKIQHPHAMKALKHDDKIFKSNEKINKKNGSSHIVYQSQQQSTMSKLNDSHNSVDCPPSSKPTIANRLLDWFSVIMTDSKHRRQHSKPQAYMTKAKKAGARMYQPKDYKIS
ncbi:proteoglycan Cow-like [Copidosoma floridanum]|uniref:proteoglycan Cow-like n=1 Tax=Copidosoma floridanum TaxID=29053 RepID=UPI0006C983CE|nr:proteoglycan Cow-like [Copidosoma floridanum]